MSDIDRKIDELLAKYQIGFVVGDKDVNEHAAKFKQAILALINEAKLEAFDIAFDCHDYDRLRAYRAELLKEVK